MECAAARNWLFRKIDGELSDSESAELDAHLAQCASCSREYRLLALSHRIALAIPPVVPSPFFYRKLRLRIDGEAQKAAGWQVFIGLARQMIPALAGITLALLSVFAYVQIRGPEADIYRAYSRVFISEDQSQRALVAEQADITDEGVLRALAER
jgi:anti-sigma factor RsiW